jgi:heme exporter protein D
MIWNDWNEFFAMGGYARYVWGSLTVTLIVIVLEQAALAQRFKAARTNARLAGARERL